MVKSAIDRAEQAQLVELFAAGRRAGPVPVVRLSSARQLRSARRTGSVTPPGQASPSTSQPASRAPAWYARS